MIKLTILKDFLQLVEGRDISQLRKDFLRNPFTMKELSSYTLCFQEVPLGFLCPSSNANIECHYVDNDLTFLFQFRGGDQIPPFLEKAHTFLSQNKDQVQAIIVNENSFRIMNRDGGIMDYPGQEF